MASLAVLLKEGYAAPAGPTTGLTAYALEGQCRKKKRRARLVAKVSVDWKANDAATSPLNNKNQPTEGHKNAGNYPKGHVSLGGLYLAVENPAGSKRRPEWPALKSHYGYVKRTTGADGDHVDVFVKPATSLDYCGSVFVVDQVDEAGKFDEHKCMIGWDSEAAARQGYLENYEPGWCGLGAITEMSMQDFKLWLKDGDTQAPVSRNLQSV